MDILRVEGLRIAFALHGLENEVVRGVSFRVPAGKTVALVGESGSGKSVISQAIMGILPKSGSVTGGSIHFKAESGEDSGLDLAKISQDSPVYRELRGGRIGMIFQEPMSSLSPVHTVGNQIEEGLRLHTNLNAVEAAERTRQMLGLVGFKDPARTQRMYPFELSGGMRQRAMLAMALICSPSLLIADEPTTALDVTIQAQILRLMKDLQNELHMAILLITHDLGVVANMADEVAVIYQGEIMESGPVEAIFRQPAHDYLKGLLKASPHFDMGEGERLVSLRDVPSGSASALKSTRSVDVKLANQPILSVKGLRKTYHSRRESWFSSNQPGVLAVDDVSFDVERGECLGLVGESGCGKTTVSKILMRAVTADSGQALFSEGSAPCDILGLKGDGLRAFRPKMQMIFQDPVSSLSPRMTVLNILREPLEIHGVGTREEQTQRVHELMRAVGLDTRFLSRYPHSFSGGQRQRIGIARALALHPELIICDEPVSALDVSVQAQILNLLKDLQKDLGLTYLFISHNLAVVNYMASRIAVMAHGRIVELAPRHELFTNPIHPYTKMLLKAVPYADLDRPLDYSAALAGGGEIEHWPAAFTPNPLGAPLKPIAVSDKHFVLARETVDARELMP